jgi:hypothetical protein
MNNYVTHGSITQENPYGAEYDKLHNIIQQL